MGNWMNLIEPTSTLGQQLGITAPVTAYLAQPAQALRGALVICQEIFGVNSHIRRVCDDYVAAGYLAIAPAFFDLIEPDVQMGYTPDAINRGRAIMTQVGLDRALTVIDAAVQALSTALGTPCSANSSANAATDTDTDTTTDAPAGSLPGKPAIIGYCWGGTLAWAAACRRTTFGCAVPYYGGGIAGLASETPNCPVIAHFGRQDHAIPMDGVQSLARQHRAVAVHVYEAGHGFNCDMRGSYDAASAALALDRTQGFLRATIG